MKKLLALLSFSLVAVAGLSVDASAALKVQVVPKTISTQAEILGVHSNQKGVVVDAIVFTGEAAADIAAAAGQIIDTSTQMVVVTGKEVAELLKLVAGNAYNLTKVVFVTAQKFATKAFELISDALEGGHATMTVSSKPSSATGAVIDVITGVANQAVAVVTNAGTTVVKVGKTVVKLVKNAACTLFSLFGLC